MLPLVKGIVCTKIVGQGRVLPTLLGYGCYCWLSRFVRDGQMNQIKMMSRFFLALTHMTELSQGVL